MERTAPKPGYLVAQHGEKGAIDEAINPTDCGGNTPLETVFASLVVGRCTTPFNLEFFSTISQQNSHPLSPPTPYAAQNIGFGDCSGSAQLQKMKWSSSCKGRSMRTHERSRRRDARVQIMQLEKGYMMAQHDDGPTFLRRLATNDRLWGAPFKTAKTVQNFARGISAPIQPAEIGRTVIERSAAAHKRPNEVDLVDQHTSTCP